MHSFVLVVMLLSLSY